MLSKVKFNDIETNSFNVINAVNNAIIIQII